MDIAPTAEPAASQTPPAPPRKRVIEALMTLAAQQPWDDIEVTDIAREAGISLSEFRDLFPSKGAVLGAFGRMIDKQVVESTPPDLAEEPARERVFDVMMRRIDALTPYKSALRRIRIAMRSDPLSLFALNQEAINSQRFMLAAAGIPTEGSLGLLKLQGAVLVMTATMETWLEDEDPTLARTMARLDRELRRGERIMEQAEDVRRLTSPLRAIGQAFRDGRARMRRPRRERTPDYDDEMNDPAGQI